MYISIDNIQIPDLIVLKIYVMTHNTSEKPGFITGMIHKESADGMPASVETAPETLEDMHMIPAEYFVGRCGLVLIAHRCPGIFRQVQVAVQDNNVTCVTSAVGHLIPQQGKFFLVFDIDGVTFSVAE